MLYLNRRSGEAMIINHTVEVRAVEVNRAAAESMHALPAIPPDGLMPGPTLGLDRGG